MSRFLYKLFMVYVGGTVGGLSRAFEYRCIRNIHWLTEIFGPK